MVSQEWKNELVSDTNLTAGWILSILEKHDPNFKKFVNDELVTSLIARDISENKGYCSKIYKTSIFCDHQKDPVYNVIMKIPTIECVKSLVENNFSNDELDKKDLEDMMIRKFAEMHNVECDFYETFKDFDGLPMPKVYYIEKCLPSEKQQGVIFMEDLSDKMQSLGIWNSLNEFQTKDIVKCLACFHAHLLENNIRWMSDAEAPIYDDDYQKRAKQTWSKILELYPEFNKPLEKLQGYIHNQEWLQFSIKYCTKSLGVPSLVQLGDLWTNNVMFEKREDNLPNKVLAFVDFQLAYEGNPALDMARIITLCTDAEIRREIEEYICDFYYENLTKYMSKTRKKPAFTVDQFQKAYDYAMINQSTWLPMLAMVFAGNKDVAENIQEARMMRLKLRTKLALEDAAAKLEKLEPSWVPTMGV